MRELGKEGNVGGTSRGWMKRSCTRTIRGFDRIWFAAKEEEEMVS